jgi:predicted acyltransferase
MALVSRELNPNRSSALDVFRGLTMAGMILVINPGGHLSYAPLEHAEWNGWTPTDLIFPSFAFILGVALMYSLASRRARTEWKGLSLFDWIVPILAVIQYAIRIWTMTGGFTHAPDPPLDGYDLFFVAVFILLIALPQLERRATRYGGSRFLQVVHHGFLIFALGFVADFNPLHPATFRPAGVLQRLGIVYLFAGLIILFTRRRGQIAFVAGLLLVYWILMKYVPVPGYGAGMLTMAGNFAGYVDRLIIGRAHMYLPQPLPYWDPEGILGAIPAIATGLIGALAGGWLLEEKAVARKIPGLVVAGALLLSAGLILSAWFPINKNLWSPSYVLFVGGIDFVLLAACIWVVDVKGVKQSLLPFIVLGSNAILIYVLYGSLLHTAGNIPGGTLNGAAISITDAAYYYLFASWLNPYNASLAMALAYVALWMVIAGVLYRRKVFVKV